MNRESDTLAARIAGRLRTLARSMSRVRSRTPDRLSVEIDDRLKSLGWKIGLVELASGCSVADRLSDVPGSSAYLVGSYNPGSLVQLRSWLPNLLDSADFESIAQAAARQITLD